MAHLPIIPAVNGRPASPFLVPAIAAAQFAPPFMISGVAVALPDIGADLVAGAIALTLVETLFLAAAVAGLLPAGRLADATDKVAVYKVGMLAFAVASILTGLVSSVAAILVLRFVQGLASAAVQSVGPALIADAVPQERRGRAFGIVIASVYAGLTLGPIIAGALVAAWGWRAVFLVGGAMVLALLAPAHFMLRARWRRPAPRTVHLPSAALLVAAMLALVGGASLIGEGILGYGMAVLGLALAAAFVAWQPRIERPLLNVPVLASNRLLGSALLVQWLIYCNAFGTVFLLSLHMQSVMGHTAAVAGQVLAVGTVLMALIAPVAGRLADRVRPSVIASCGVALALAACVAAAFLDRDSSLAVIAGVLAVQGLGFALFSSPNMTMVMNAVPPERTGIAGALSASARSLGMVTGMLMVGALVSLHLGHNAIGADPAAFVETMRMSFWVLAALTAAALVISIKRT